MIRNFGGQHVFTNILKESAKGIGEIGIVITGLGICWIIAGLILYALTGINLFI